MKQIFVDDFWKIMGKHFECFLITAQKEWNMGQRGMMHHKNIVPIHI